MLIPNLGSTKNTIPAISNPKNIKGRRFSLFGWVLASRDSQSITPSSLFFENMFAISKLTAIANRNNIINRSIYQQPSNVIPKLYSEYIIRVHS